MLLIHKPKLQNMKNFTRSSTNRFHKRFLSLLLAVIISCFGISSAKAIAPGAYAIGPQATYAGYLGTYPTFSAAITAASVALTGNMVFEFQSDYMPSVEVLPISMSSNIGSSVTATVTFRPASNVAALITFAGTGTVLNNGGASYITIDGRPGGVGANKFLQFTSSSTTAPTVLLSGNSVFNQFLYCGVKGSNTTQLGGIMTISAPQTFSGNNNYTINNSNFDGSGVARNLLFTIWTASDATITFNNFFDYRNGSGISLTTGSNNAVIDNNNFYQTTTYNGFNGITYGINVNGGSNNRISNNNIGGSGPLLTGTWTVSAIAPDYYSFSGIYAIFTIGPNKIYNNKIQNFDWKSNTSTWTGIDISGPANVGTDGANFIGSNTGIDNIKVTYSPDAATGLVKGIATIGAPIIENNNIGSITTLLAAGTTGASGSITGIYATGSGLINNNTIGSLTTPMSINASNQSTSTGGQQNVYGIHSLGSNVVMTNNKIANINNGSTDAAGTTKGIYLPNWAATVSLTSNSIFSISTSQPNTGANFSGASLNGIDIQASNATSITVTGNTIYDLVNTAATAAVSVNGIYYNASTGVNNKIERNYIHSFKTVSNAAIQNGLNINYGACTFQNNVIRLGIDITGASITSTTQINGILKSTNSDVKYYFNTVFIGGSGVAAGTVKTYAFTLAYHGLGEDIRNNIFVNMRTNAVANKQHYAISLPAIGGNPWTNDYNIYNVSTTDGMLASIAGVDKINIAALQSAYIGSDLHSGVGDPLLTSPAAAMATMNLMPLNFTPAEGNGIAVATVTDDFAGLLRSGLTPTDIGAYAGNFTPAGPAQDIFAPVISYALLGNASTATPRTTTAFAMITDNMGVNVASLTKPRIYYKLTTNADAFVGNTVADNGWKWVEATSTSVAPLFNFSIDYSLLFGGPVAFGNFIQYFVVAQDLATVPNVSFMPSLGASGTGVAPAGMIAPTSPNSYKIVPTLLATLTVGVGKTYPTLTGTGGLFEALNNSVISANSTAYIYSDLNEPGTVSLNQISEEGPNAGTLTFTIASSSGIASGSRYLTGVGVNALSPMISITGAKRLNFYGSPPGFGARFVINNTSANPANTGPVLKIDNSSQVALITNCLFESDATTATSGVITVGSIGTNSVTINKCNIHESTLTPFGSPTTGIYSNSINNTLTITNNNIYNFKNPLWYYTAYGIYITAASGCTITGNSIYMAAGMNPVSSLTGIYFSGIGNNSITGNYIGGSAALGGGMFTIPGNNITFTGIYSQTSVPGTTIQNNKIQNISMGSLTSTFYGINNWWGPVFVVGNTIGSAATANSIQLAGTGTSVGIKNSDQSGMNSSTFLGNTIANILLTSSPSTPVFMGMMMTGGIVQKNNIFNIAVATGSTNPNIYGIYNVTGLALNEYSNNTISLDGGISNNPTLNGFYDASASVGTSGFYYNSININGSAVNSTAINHAFIRTGTTGYIFKDNILANSRIGGTGINYAITADVATNFVSNYNDLFVAGPILGRWNGVDYANLATWKAASVQDANSISADPMFTSAINLLPSILSPVVASGTPIPAVLTDINNLVRGTTSTTMGAYDFGCIDPKTGGTITANQAGCGSYTPNPLASTVIPTGFNGTLEYKWQSAVAPFTTWTDIATSNSATYAPGLIAQTTQFKRVAHAACSATLPWPTLGESNIVTITVESAVVAAGAITGSTTFVPGTSGIPYSVGAIANATSYVWAYSGIGVTINGTGNAVTLDFVATATIGTLTVQGKNTCGFGVASSLAITLVPKMLNLTVFLEGPFNGTTAMSTALNGTPQLIPLAQPFNVAPWNYTGTESVTSIPAGVVDWVLVELRDATSPVAAIPTTKVVGWPKACFINANGAIVALDGTSMLNIGNPTIVNTLYVIVRHRNHIGIMSANSLTVNGNTFGYNFSTALAQAYGGILGFKQIGTGVFGMVSGDTDADGQISVLDFSRWATDFGKTVVYSSTDIDMDGQISVLDFSKWATNFGITNPIMGPHPQVSYKSQIPE